MLTDWICGERVKEDSKALSLVKREDGNSI